MTASRTLKEDYIAKFCCNCIRAGMSIEYDGKILEILFTPVADFKDDKRITHCYVPKQDDCSNGNIARFVKLDNTAIWNCKIFNYKVTRAETDEYRV